MADAAAPAALLDADRLRALDATGLLDSPPEASFDRLTALARRIVGAPVVLFSLVDGHRQFFKSAPGLTGWAADARGTPLSHSFCQHVVAEGGPLRVDDARTDPLVQANLAVRDLNVIGYLGVPVRDPDGHVLGSLCALEPAPRTWTDDDVRALGDLAALLTTELALRAANGRLEATVDDRTRALEAANRDLAARNRELQEFAYAASHDLQEPLRKVQAYAGLLRDPDHPPSAEERDLYLDRMTKAAGRMRQLINDLLLFSRVATRSGEPHPVPLGSVLIPVLTDLDVALRESGGRVDVVGPLPEVWADPVQIRQVLQNLVGNAIKFRRDGVAPVVTVTGGADATGAWLTVADNGIGFDEKYLDRIFRPFQRLHARDAYEGTGMGLAIVQRIAERHGGAVAATSAPGAGAAFTVRFPVPAA